MKKIIKNACIDCTDFFPRHFLNTSLIADILGAYRVIFSYDKEKDIIRLDIGKDKPLEIKRGSYLVQYDDDSTEFLSKFEFDEKMREQQKNNYGLFW